MTRPRSVTGGASPNAVCAIVPDGFDGLTYASILGSHSYNSRASVELVSRSGNLQERIDCVL